MKNIHSKKLQSTKSVQAERVICNIFNRILPEEERVIKLGLQFGLPNP